MFIAKNFISNSEESIRMFKANWMKVLSKVHLAVPLFIYIPVIVFLCYKSIAGGIGILSFAGYFYTGLLVWALTEYLLHLYQDASKRYGVSSNIWDKIFHSGFAKIGIIKKNRAFH